MNATDFNIVTPNFTLDRIAPGGRVGLISLATDFTIESELPRMLPNDVGLYVNRVRNKNPLTVENLRWMEQDLARAADGILPGMDVDVMIYACTSGSAAIGSDRVAAAIHSMRPDVPVTNPVVATRAALKALNVHRVSILTPYPDSINRTLIPSIMRDGDQVLNVTGLNVDDDLDIAAIPLDVIINAAKHVIHPEAEALFLSCTALRGAQVVAELEASLGLPVLASNQVLAWHARRLLGNSTAIHGFGQIFEID